MSKSIKLNNKNLSLLPDEVIKPGYDRSKIKTGIVHIGVGGFHRSHQAFYTDEFLKLTGETSWGICGISLLDKDLDMYNALVQQDGLYTLMYNEPDGRLSARIIGSIVEYYFAPGNQEQVIEKMAHRDVKIITLTITEGGYNFDEATGEFLIGKQSVQWDLKNPQYPKTVFGFLTEAFKRRMNRGTGGLTIQSCDNIQHNGGIAKKMLYAYLDEADPDLKEWVEKNISFPNSMVDRITPVTTPAEIENIKTIYGIIDSKPVVCEPFYQWIIEDGFIRGRPAWELAGAQFVSDVTPYEKLKIRIINGGHSALGFTGYLLGHAYVHEAAGDPVVKKFLKEFFDEEVTPVLDPVPGLDIEEYKSIALKRFENPFIKDNLTRILSESSAKIPKFIIPTIKEQLERGGSVLRSAIVIAAWCHYLERSGTSGNNYEIQDKNKEILLAGSKSSVKNNTLDFLKIDTIFGDLVSYEHFVSAYLLIINKLRKFGIKSVLTQLTRN